MIIINISIADTQSSQQVAISHGLIFDYRHKDAEKIIKSMLAAGISKSLSINKLIKNK